MVTGQSLEGTPGYEVSLPDTIRFVVESGMDLNGEFTTEFDTDLGESTFETGLFTEYCPQMQSGSFPKVRASSH